MVTTSETILNDPTFVPPSPPSSLTSGPTLQLRQKMARFSGPDNHPERRAAVVAVIDQLDLAELGRAAQDLSAATSHEADTATDAVDRLASSARDIATVAMAQTLGLPVSDPQTLVAAVSVIAAVIGRGEDRQPEADAAVEQLTGSVGAARDAVSVLSVLYQNCDATAALIVESLKSRVSGEPRRPAVVRTVRQATGDVVLLGNDGSKFAVRAGEVVTVDLEAEGLEFGAGHHGCPGREAAEAIVAGILAGLDETWPS